MDYTSDGDSEVEAYGSGTFELLESGDLKVMTDEGLYRCPFCSDEDKDHSLNDLLQHASSVGAAHDRQAKEKADHHALARHLKGKPVESSGALLQPMLTDVQDPEHTQDEQFVWPWMAILVNMPNEFFGKSANRLKEHYSSFHPVKVHPVYSKGRPTRDAVFEFGNDWSGFRNARAFDAHFAMKGYSKICWKEMKCECTEPVGWMARADDYSSLGAIGELLRKNGDVKTLKDIGSEGANKTEKLLSNLACKVKEKEIHLEQLESEFNKHSASLNIMMQKREQQLQSYNQEILKMRQLGQQNTQRIVEENRKLRSDIQDMVDALDARNKQIEQSEHDKKNLEQEKLKNAMRTNHLRLAALEQEKADENVQKLVDKQTRETKAILDDFLRLNKQLEKQKLELEINHLSGKLQVMELKPGDEDPESREKKDKLKEELKPGDEDPESREKKDKLKEELKPGDEDPESRVASVTKRHSSGGMRPDPYCDNLFYPGQPVRVGDASVFQAARWLSGCCQSTRVKGTVARVELADVLVFWVSSARLGGTKRLELVQASAPPPQQRARDLAFFCSDNLCFWGISDRCFLRDADALTTPPTAAATTPPMSVVTDTRTTVDVLWQDGTRLHGVPSASLVHFDSHAEVFFPGQRVVSLDAIEDGPAAAAAVPRVGIVRDVNWKDQTVPVSWVVAQQPGAGRRGGGAHGGGRDDDRGERVRSGQGLRPRRLLWRCCRTHCWRRHGSSSGCGCRRRRSFMGRPRC